jgi:hypothetical protein
LRQFWLVAEGNLEMLGEANVGRRSNIGDLGAISCPSLGGTCVILTYNMSFNDI